MKSGRFLRPLWGLVKVGKTRKKWVLRLYKASSFLPCSQFINKLFIVFGHLPTFCPLLKTKVATKNRPGSWVFCVSAHFPTFFLIFNGIEKFSFYKIYREKVGFWAEVDFSQKTNAVSASRITEEIRALTLFTTWIFSCRIAGK